MERVYEAWQLLEYTKRLLAYESDKMPELRGLVESFWLLMNHRAT